MRNAATAMLVVFAAVLMIGLAVASLVTVSVSVRGAGSLEPGATATARAQLDGVVTQTLVHFGDTVVKGQPLVLLDTLELSAARASLEFRLKNEFRRSAAPQERGGSTPVNLKTQELESEIDIVRAKLERLVIRAPIDGLVVSDLRHRQAGALVRQGDATVDIIDPTSWNVVLNIAESDVHDVRPGDSVGISIPALTALQSRRIDGIVTTVGIVPVGSAAPGARQSEVQSVAYAVVVALDASQLQRLGVTNLRNGFSASGTIITRREVVLNLLAEKLFGQLHNRHQD